MPHTTHGYGFEGRVLAFAERFSAALVPEGGSRSFLMVLGEDGGVRSVQFVRPEDGWHRLTKQLDDGGASYLFFDPFDAPEYTWVSWRAIARPAMERLLGEPFRDADFRKLPHAGSRARDLPPGESYPDTWGVMF